MILLSKFQLFRWSNPYLRIAIKDKNGRRKERKHDKESSGTGKVYKRDRQIMKVGE